MHKYLKKILFYVLFNVFKSRGNTLPIQSFVSKECKAGWHGGNCSQQCSGHCRGGVACNHVTGQCEGGCDAGWTGAFCHISNN